MAILFAGDIDDQGQVPLVQLHDPAVHHVLAPHQVHPIDSGFGRMDQAALPMGSCLFFFAEDSVFSRAYKQKAVP